MTGTRGPIGQTPQQAWLKGGKPKARPKKRDRTVARLTMPEQLAEEGAEAAAELWRAVVPKLCKAGLLTAEDVPALTDMCVCWQRLTECEREITRDGVTVDGYRGSLVKHPAVTIAKGYRESLQKYFQKFGLQPMDRQRLPEKEEPVVENPILKLLTDRKERAADEERKQLKELTG